MTKARVLLPSASSVVARSHPDHIIGIENKLPWHLGTDLKHFKRRTIGHAIIMGRKTYESIGKPLPNRENIVLSRSPIQEVDGLKWAPNVETALLLADSFAICNFQKQFYVIGGEEIYRLFERFINKVFITEVFCGRINGDAKFDMEFSIKEWWFPYEEDFPKSDVDDHPFRITCMIRKKPYHRYLAKAEILERYRVSSDALDEYERERNAADDVEVRSPKQLLLL